MRRLAIEGTSRGHCESTVEDALQNGSGVERATADRDAERVSIEGDAAVDSLAETIEDAGYTAHT